MKTGVTATDEKLRVRLLLAGRALMGHDLRGEDTIDILFKDDMVCMLAWKRRISKPPGLFQGKIGQVLKLFAPFGGHRLR